MAIRMSGTPPWEYKARMFKYTNEDLIKTDKTLFQYIALISKYEAYYTAPEHQRQLIGDDAVGRSIAFFDKRKFTEPHGFFVQHKPMEREVYLHMEFDYMGENSVGREARTEPPAEEHFGFWHGLERRRADPPWDGLP